MDSPMQTSRAFKAAFARAKGIPIEHDTSGYLAIADEATAPGGRPSDLPGLLAASRAFMDTRRRQGYGGREEREQGGRKDLAPALALAVDAARLGLGLEPFRIQVAAAAALSGGKVVEMATGEGKTLAAALAAASFALCGTNVQVFTANDYLAERDAAWMSGLYGALGLRTAAIVERSSREERRQAYASDILYLTAREAGFDYLRDGLAGDAGDVVSGEPGAAIFDEADFVLIDEARVPLVIAGGRDDGDQAGIGPLEADALAASLGEGRDYRVDTRRESVFLTLQGHARLSVILAGGGIPADEDLARVNAALTARCILRRDVDYVVRDGAVRPVDEFTGRRTEERRWPWGLQAALEAKEGVACGEEGRILGTITVEHLAARYPVMAAMTATAEAAAEDFSRYYGLGTVLFEPRLPSRRRDLPDAVYRTRKACLEALADEVAANVRTGRPVLVGTQSVAESEEVAGLLRRRGMRPVVLNARDDGAEAAIIAGAGRAGALTISTNMAGRGTDIRLGGPREGLSEAGLAQAEEETARVAAQGGLLVLGLGRRESIRVEQQLRGRAGRQGEPGESRFYVSLEDDYFRRYGVRSFLPRDFREEAVPDDGAPIADRHVIRELDRARSIIAQRNNEQRRTLRKYSLIVELDRRAMRAMRDAALIEAVLPPELEDAIAAAAAAGPARPEKKAAAIPVFLERLDGLWARHLALAEELREGAGLLAYGHLDPGIEYVKRMGDAFEAALREAVAATAEDIAAGRMGAAGPQPRAGRVWTYVSQEESLPAFSILGAQDDLGAAIGRAAAGMMAAIAELFGRGRRADASRRGPACAPPR
jgi:preprotein translocase subunit SecA